MKGYVDPTIALHRPRAAASAASGTSTTVTSTLHFPLTLASKLSSKGPRIPDPEDRITIAVPKGLTYPVKKRFRRVLVTVEVESSTVSSEIKSLASDGSVQSATVKLTVKGRVGGAGSFTVATRAEFDAASIAALYPYMNVECGNFCATYGGLAYNTGPDDVRVLYMGFKNPGSDTFEMGRGGVGLYGYGILFQLGQDVFPPA